MDLSTAEKSKRFLFNTQFHWPYAPVDYSLAMALRARGHEVLMVACGGLPNYCERETDRVSRPPCELCLKRITDNFEKFDLPYIILRDCLTENDLGYANNIGEGKTVEELLKLNIRGIPVGKLAWLNLFQYYHGYPFEITQDKEKVFRRCINSGVLLTLAKERTLNHYKPDMLITANGKFLQWAPFVYFAKQRNIPFVTWEDINIIPSGTIFAVNDIAHEQNIDAVWAEECKKPLSKQDRAQLQNHFRLWANGQLAPVAFNQTVERDKDNIRETLGLRDGARIVSLFPNVSWDSSSVGFDDAFESMYDWVFKCVSYLQKRPDIEFVVRAHPAEIKMPDHWKSSTPICDEIRRRCSSLPHNIKLVDSYSPISSYALADISDVVMVYTSTLGIEFALQGKRPWVAAQPYYSGKGFTLDLKSPQHMFDLLDSNNFENRLTPEQIDLAERFAYIVRFRRFFSFPYLDSTTGKFAPPSLDVFALGGNHVIDNLCSYILTGEPFLDIGTKKRNTSVNVLPSQAESHTVVADENLSNVKSFAKQERFGNWQVRFNGLTIYCHDLLAFYIAAKDIFLHRIYDFAAETDRPVVIDGGGHIGLFTLFTKQKHPNAKITVFEPDKESLRLLRKNLEANLIDNVKIVEAGLYKNNGEISFSADHSEGSSIYSKEKNATINVVRLSEYIECDIDFLKLNIEGAELDVITEIEPKLQMVKELVIEYHGFPGIGQNLHKILAILERTGFRYMIHDFDAETNPATKPPFRLNEQTRFFLLIHAKKLFPPTKSQTAVHDFTDKNTSLQPISRLFGFDRGTPLDRYYIENFLKKNASCICGHVLEIAGNEYTKKYGTAITQSDVLNSVPSPQATIIGDLASGENIPESAFDCIILTQTIQFIYDVKSVLQNAVKALKPGGTLLITTSGISQISRYDMDRWGEYWRFTDKSLKKLLAEILPEEAIDVRSHGNVAIAKAFLDGRALHELSKDVLDDNDNDYQVILTARVQKPKVKTNKGLITCQI